MELKLLFFSFNLQLKEIYHKILDKKDLSFLNQYFLALGKLLEFLTFERGLSSLEMRSACIKADRVEKRWADSRGRIVEIILNVKIIDIN